MASSSAIPASTDALQRLRDGQEEAFSELFASYRDRLYQIVSVRMDRRLAGRVDPDDVLQEVYLDAAARLHHYINHHSGSFFIWLRLITTQTMANTFRRHLIVQMRDARREVSINSGQASENPTTPIALQLLGRLTSPSRAAMRDETIRLVVRAIEAMKPLDREIITLRHFEQLENQEVAEVLGLNAKAASIRYIRALGRLKELLLPISLADGGGGQADARCE